MRRVLLATVGPAGEATNAPRWHECCASCALLDAIDDL